jgi:putative SOS response-associated peptidase YedK
MCYWVGTKKVREEMQRRRNEAPDDEIAQLYYDTFLTSTALAKPREFWVAMGKAKPRLNAIVRHDTKLKIEDMQWTLPYSYLDKKTGQVVRRELLNSTREKVFFQHSDLIYRNRCLVPIDGYYEYYHHSKEVYPHFIHPIRDGIFYAGAIWNEQADPSTGEVIPCFSIITTPPNELTRKLHNNPKAPNGPRMLLLIAPENTQRFLDPGLDKTAIQSLLEPMNQGEMDAYPVMRFQRKENIDYLETEKVREYHQYPGLIA